VGVTTPLYLQLVVVELVELAETDRRPLLAQETVGQGFLAQ
jgi:hypothetical protein